jgi:hypothetical protein
LKVYITVTIDVARRAQRNGGRIATNALTDDRKIDRAQRAVAIDVVRSGDGAEGRGAQQEQ